MGLIVTLLVIWLVLSILGFVLEGLLWLAFDVWIEGEK